MRKIIITLLCFVFLMQFLAADIIIDKQPNEFYNLGETLSVPITITSPIGIYGFLETDLICSGQVKDLPDVGIALAANEEKKVDISLFLINTFIGNSSGNCQIKAKIGDDWKLTNEFKILNNLNVNASSEKDGFNPEEEVVVSGKVSKENGDSVKGYVDVTLILDDVSKDIISQSTVNNGDFSVSFKLPKDTRAGRYAVNVKVYEKDPLGETTNTGFVSYNIQVYQVQTSLEILTEKSEINPGETFRTKAMLYDQTGEKMNSSILFTIKNNNDKIIKEFQVDSDEYINFEVPANEVPATWKVFAISDNLSDEYSFKINRKESISVEIINKTLVVKNTGNVPYNKTIPVMIGEEVSSVLISLEVGNEERYLLSAPDGEYDVEVLGVKRSVALTGNAIDIRKVSDSVVELVRHPYVWIFVIIILAIIAFMIFRKGYKKSFVGYIDIKKKGDINEMRPIEKKSLINSRNIAELSLSIQGEKQDVSVVGVKLKNAREIESTKEGSVRDTLQKAVNFAEGCKALTYKSQDIIFFIFAPSKTKTFKNEDAAIGVGKEIKEMFDNHNRYFKQKIDFGIALNYGEIISAQDKDSLKFMSIGSLVTFAKKIASISNGEILLGDKFKEKLGAYVKVEKQNKGGVDVFVIKEIRDPEQHQKFLRGFSQRQDRR